MAATYLAGEISSRNEFPRLLNKRNLVDEAVEIGTHRGDFAKIFLDGWRGKTLHCIDPWSVPEGYELQAEYLWGGGTREDDYQAAQQVQKEFPKRVQLHRMLSTDAVVNFADECLDFIYVDGNHEYEYVLLDLQLWWPKLKRGGILAGHDILCPGPNGEDNWSRFIQPAVYEFATWKDRDIHLVVEEGGLPWSYYLEK